MQTYAEQFRQFDAKPATPDGVTVTIERVVEPDDNFDYASDYDHPRGDCVSVTARGHVSIVTNGIGICITIDSPGLYGIEIASDDDPYLDEVFAEECETLKSMVEDLRTLPLYYR